MTDPVVDKIVAQKYGTDPDPVWVVVLMGSRNPYDGEGGLRVVHAPDAETAVRNAHDRPPSTVAVKFAWVCQLAEPYEPVMVPADVPKPEWGKPKSRPRRQFSEGSLEA